MTTPDPVLTVSEIIEAVANGLPRDIAERASLLLPADQREELRLRLDDAELNARRAELNARHAAAEVARQRPDYWYYRDHEDCSEIDEDPFVDDFDESCGALVKTIDDMVWECTRGTGHAGRHVACGGGVIAAWPGTHTPSTDDLTACAVAGATGEPEPGDTRPGTVDATVQVLTGNQARAQYPDLFSEDDGETYFDDGDATGNAHWADYMPDLVLVVTTSDGRVVMASNASAWHLTACGYDIPEDDAR